MKTSSCSNFCSIGTGTRVKWSKGSYKYLWLIERFKNLQFCLSNQKFTQRTHDICNAEFILKITNFNALHTLTIFFPQNIQFADGNCKRYSFIIFWHQAHCLGKQQPMTALK